MSRARPPVQRLTATQADRLYRLRHGTAAQAFRAGLIAGDVRRGRGFAGRIILLRSDDCERVLPTYQREIDSAIPDHQEQSS